MLARVLGVGSAVPARRVANEDLAQRVETSDEWIRTRTGIRERRVLGRGERLIDLMEAAARGALERAGLAAGDLDAIVVGTVSGEYAFPSTACELSTMTGCSNYSFAPITRTIAAARLPVRSSSGFNRKRSTRNVRRSSVCVTGT